MNNIYFITDLDRTIIHSKNKGYKCVETMEDREITYMTNKAHNDLHKLLSLNNFKFIPCTMRNISQTLRVDFIKEYNPEIIICSNGAQIYINGQLDKVWDERMKGICSIDELKQNIHYLNKVSEQFNKEIKVLEIRNIENFYITIKCSTNEDANRFYEKVYNKFNNNLNIIKIGVKIFVISKNIDKAFAVDYIVERFGIKKLITSGDSEVDREFTKRGISILPKHSVFRHENSIITNKSKINSTEDILQIINNIIEKM